MTFTNMHVGVSAVLVYTCADTCIKTQQTQDYAWQCHRVKLSVMSLMLCLLLGLGLPEQAMGW